MKVFAILFLIFCSLQSKAQLSSKTIFTKADTLRGSITEYRDWWDVLSYQIRVKPNFETKEIVASNKISFDVLDDKYKKNKVNDSAIMQIDLHENLEVDSIIFNRWFTKLKSNRTQYYKKLPFKREGNCVFLKIYDTLFTANIDKQNITIYYHGKPIIANNPPWDGGWIWKKDKFGRPFVSVACQGLGASSWYPCKDHQSDEPQLGATLHITVPDSLVAIGNGIQTQSQKHENSITYTWQVKNPINSYNIVPYIGKYVNFTDTFMGSKGKLDLNFWVLDYNKEKAQQQFSQVKQMLRAFEHWFGAYPFYEDGYKLVESPHLGMEHQSNIAYGNKFNNGYLGRDLSGTAWGLKWDFIIIHESGHEWFANNITTADIADMWVHEGFTCYSETLFTEYYYGKEAGNEYCKGLRKNIRNDKPIIGPYGVNKEGSGDMYYKAANMIHSIRHTINDDEKFRKMLVEMNTKFYHSIVTTKQIENFINEFTGYNFNGTFNQYLRATTIPSLEYEINGRKLKFRYTNCIDEFDLPITFQNKTIYPTTQWKTTRIKRKILKQFTKENIELNYLLQVNKIAANEP
jgi:aminopeptidase N